MAPKLMMFDSDFFHLVMHLFTTKHVFVISLFDILLNHIFFAVLLFLLLSLIYECIFDRIHTNSLITKLAASSLNLPIIFLFVFS